MSLAPILARYATTAAALLLIFGATLAWLVTRDPAFKRDMRSAQRYLVTFVLLELLRKLVPDEWTSVDKLSYIACLTIFTFGAIRGAAGVWFHFRRSRTNIETPKILRDVVDAGLFLLALVFIAQATLDINLSAVLASSAVLSLVLGLALQDTLGNLFSGLALQAERPFSEGDWVRIGSHSGRLLDLGWRATRILTGSGEVLILPNNAVGKEAIYNLSRHGGALRKVTVSVGYDEAPNTLKDSLLALARAHPGIATEPAPSARVADLGASLVTYELLFWVKKFEQGMAVEDDVRTQIWYRLRRAGIVLPAAGAPMPLTRVRASAAPMPPVDVAALFAKVDFLAVLSEPVRAELATRARVVTFGSGEVILQQGDSTPGPCYIVAAGEVSVRVRPPDGAPAEVARLSTPGFFGEMALLTGEPRTASVLALCDTTVVSMERHDFADLFEHHPELAALLADVLARRRQGLAEALAEACKPGSPPAHESSQLLDRLRHIFRQLT